MKFGIVSDTHHHSWSAFSTVNADGINSRLQIILNETWRAAEETKAFGGKSLIHCGDLFHVRGSLEPTVLNPTKDLYRRIEKELGLEVILLGGNHDQESRESTRISNAMTAMDVSEVISTPTLLKTCGQWMRFIPWIPKIADLKTVIESLPVADRADTILFLHAPIDGVLVGLPDHNALSPEYLKDLGYKAIFCGHYHNHKAMPGSIYSVGASTHQTWGDVGSKAGFCLVTTDDYPIEVNWRKSRAPSFVEIGAGMSEEDILDTVDGNYVRVRMNTGKSSEIEAMREYLNANGAAGVVVLAEPPKTVIARGTTGVGKASSVDHSIAEFVNASLFTNKHAVLSACNDILSTARSAA